MIHEGISDVAKSRECLKAECTVEIKKSEMYNICRNNVELGYHQSVELERERINGRKFKSNA